MRTPFARLIRLLLASSFALFLAVAGARSTHAQCTPASCDGTFQHVDFESLPAGAPVEGPGFVHPSLTITSVTWPFGPACPPTSARVIEEGNPFPFIAYSTSSGINGCLNGTHGFADPAECAFDYDFTLAAGVIVSCFGMRMVDYGDYYPYGGVTHTVTLSAYDAGNNLVDQTVLSVGGGVDSTSGDACLSQAGMPGNYFLSVAGPGIVIVTLRLDANADPNVGYDDIVFCEQSEPTPNVKRTWGSIKTMYR